ncbi:MAG: universal stress protein [Acidimicrobiia bacterium]|nr:universal stress protein [Acidimicrobiia bacterium]
MQMRTIVLGYDGSPMAERALEAVIRLADEDSTVHVVTASAPLSDKTRRQLVDLPEDLRINFDPHLEAEATLAKGVATLTDAGLGVESHLMVGDPGGAILDVAESVDADLVVVGSRAMSRVARFVRGSVSARVAAHAPHSVLVIHVDE